MTLNMIKCSVFPMYVLHIVDTVGRVLGHWTGFAVLALVTTSGLSTEW